MKKFFLIATFVSLGWAVLWNLAQFFNMSWSTPALEKQTFALMTSLKWHTMLLFYIAWRVTPSTKS